MKAKSFVLLCLVFIGPLLAGEKPVSPPIKPLDEEYFIKAGFIRSGKPDRRLEMQFKDKAAFIAFFATIGFEYEKQPYLRKGATIFEDRKVFNYRGFFFHAIEDNPPEDQQDDKPAVPKSYRLVVKRLDQ